MAGEEKGGKEGGGTGKGLTAQPGRLATSLAFLPSVAARAASVAAATAEETEEPSVALRLASGLQSCSARSCEVA